MQKTASSLPPWNACDGLLLGGGEARRRQIDSTAKRAGISRSPDAKLGTGGEDVRVLNSLTIMLVLCRENLELGGSKLGMLGSA